MGCEHPGVYLDKNWNARSGKFLWYGGEVTLPKGYRHIQLPGDSDNGVLMSPDRSREILYDIGTYAGNFAENRPDDVFFEERDAQGFRVWIRQSHVRGATRNEFRFAVTIPDAGPANFYFYSERSEDLQVAKEIAASFRPSEFMKSRLRGSRSWDTLKNHPVQLLVGSVRGRS